MNIVQFNDLPAGEAAMRLADCCAAARWVDGMLGRRPFGDSLALLESACALWAGMEEADLLEAFAAHPRIGDIGSLREKYAATRSMAAGEQSRVAGADEATLRELARLNSEYERRFGFIFIVYATGKSAAEMLELLRSRINNTRSAELDHAAAEQLKITLLRLDKLLS